MQALLLCSSIITFTYTHHLGTLHIFCCKCPELTLIFALNLSNWAPVKKLALRPSFFAVFVGLRRSFLQGAQSMVKSRFFTFYFGTVKYVFLPVPTPWVFLTHFLTCAHVTVPSDTFSRQYPHAELL